MTTNLPLQPASEDIWNSKYALYHSKTKERLDNSVEDTYSRVASAIADVEDESIRDEWANKFAWAMENGAIPAGRITSNAGAKEHKPATSTINCTVSATIQDSMDGILHAVHQAGLTLKAGCGIGYEFSTIRPNGAWVSGAGSTTSGVLPFMNIFDTMCRTVSSAGGRRGAQMATFDISHPDVEAFIAAKREDGMLRQFNLSLLITDDFVSAVRNDEEWPLVFPTTEAEMAAEGLTKESLYYRDWPITDGYIVDEKGLVGCKIYRTVRAKDLWHTIMKSTYDFAEPGFILIDKVNEMNNNWFCENIRATNPCGEQPLPPNGSCLLGSINLTKMVKDPFTSKAKFDMKLFSEVVSVFTRMLDNVVEINGLPLAAQRHEIETKRRHGMGFLGLGSTLSMLGMKYGSPESLELTEEISKTLAFEGFKTGLALAKEKGAAPIMNETFEVTPKMLRQRPEMVKDGYKLGDMVEGKILFAKYSRYMANFNSVKGGKALLKELAEVGSRFTHHSSIAPTGTISLSLANNASNGIEPSFSHHYSRNVIRPGRKTKEKVDVFAYELLAYRALVNPNAMPFAEDEANKLPEYFSVTDDVTPEQHVLVQAAAQKWIDSSISKTANVPTDIQFADFQDIYMTAYDNGLKGCTTFRFNPEAFQGVLVKSEDLKATKYKFTLEGGEVLELAGDEEVEYEGEIVTGANLFERMKEGSFA